LNEIPNIGSTINIKELFLNDPKDEFFNYFNYYTYQGSLTAPPCTGIYKCNNNKEYVTWYVVEEPIHGGYMALTVFKETLINFPVVYF
jgi:carbonic anhydrase